MRIPSSPALILALACLGGCTAPRGGLGRRPEIVFPPPPDAPRIRYLGSIASRKDLSGPGQGSARLKNVLLGRPADPPSLARPYGLWAHGARIYVADSQAASVVVFDEKRGSVERIGASAQGRLTTPIGVAVDETGRIFVSDSSGNVVKAFTSDGSLVWQAGELGAEAGKLRRPTGLAVGPTGEVFVADTGNSRVIVLSPDGRWRRTVGLKGAGDGEFSVPTNLWVERDGTLLVTDTILCRVQGFDQFGKFLFKFGECGDTAGFMSRPRGVASDSDGNIYVVDALFDAVQMFDRQGKLLLFFGGHGSAPASFDIPAGIHIDPQDRIVVADSFNRRVDVFQYVKNPR